MILPRWAPGAIAVVIGISGVSSSAQPALRRPAGIAAVDGKLLVANSGTGTISVIDPGRRRVLGEVEVGRSLGALEPLNDGQWLLATDPVTCELLLLERRGQTVSVAERVAVAPSPVAVRAAADGTACAVSSLWARRVTFFRLARAAEKLTLERGGSADLRIAPGEGLFSADSRSYLAADAFGGELCVVEVATGRVVRQLTIPGHNVRGLAVGPKGDDLLVTHQILNPEAGTTHGNVFWGELMGNTVRMVELAKLFGPGAAGDLGPAVAVDRGAHPLGRPGDAAGDPGAILVTPRGHTLVCLTGVGDVALQYPPNTPFTRIPTGRGPVALAATTDGREAYVANRFDDTVSVIDLDRRACVATVSLGPRREPTLAERGEQLFHDARLSLDGWYSCHSCHTDGHTNGLLSDGFADGTYGTPKRVPSLHGARDTAPWAWNGGQDSLEEQARRSLLVTMQGKEEQATADAIRAIAAYVRSLAPPPPVALARGDSDDGRAERGRLVFEKRGCGECHEPPAYTTNAVHDVGLADERGLRRFNPPSLRGVSQRAPYLHDGSAATLSDVLASGHPGDGAHDAGELRDLVSFLERL
jgi:YVTN family beta-propeller protein